MSRAIASSLTAAVLALALFTGASQAQSPAALFAEHCAACHGADRLGGQGPALIPEALVRVREKGAHEVILTGRAATQMPAFAGKPSAEAVTGLVKYIFTPLANVPDWREPQISASRELHPAPPRADKPVFAADPLNLFVVVETGDHHVTILDGDKFEPLHRFKSRFALHGGPKFTLDGRYVFFASRDGWITKFDLWTLTVLAEVRAGLNTRNIAISRDGRHIAVANYLPHTLVMLSTR